MLNTLMMLAVNNVKTGDERDIVLWIVLAVAALALVIITGLLSVFSKKKK